MNYIKLLTYINLAAFFGVFVVNAYHVYSMKTNGYRKVDYPYWWSKVGVTLSSFVMVTVYIRVLSGNVVDSLEQLIVTFVFGATILLNSLSALLKNSKRDDTKKVSRKLNDV